MLLSGVCQSWFGMAFSNNNSLTGVFQQAPSSLDGHNNSAELSSIRVLRLRFSVTEKHFLLHTSFGRETRNRCTGDRSLEHDCLLQPQSLCHFAVEDADGCAQSVVGFAAIDVAMLLTFCRIRLLSVLWIWSWAQPCFIDERLCPAGRDACSWIFGEHSRVCSVWLLPRSPGLGCWNTGC